MLSYILRRVLYAIPILIGVNLITFALFFVVNTPDDMARMQLGAKRVTPEAIAKWKAERGYDRPLLWNDAAAGTGRLTQTIFFEKSARLFVFDFGAAEDKRDIATEIRARVGPSLALAIPVFLVGLAVNITFALGMAFFRATPLDFAGVVLCVAMMSISTLFYIIGGQYLASKLWHLVPISGYDSGLNAAKFLVLPVMIGVLSGVGSGSRWYRTLFLEEMGKDYVRTALAKGVGNMRVLTKHVLKNGLIAIITLTVGHLPALIMGSLLIESFFGIPGLGNQLFLAIQQSDQPVVMACVFLGALLYLFALTLTDVLYAFADPRIRLS